MSNEEQTIRQGTQAKNTLISSRGYATTGLLDCQIATEWANGTVPEYSRGPVNRSLPDRISPSSAYLKLGAFRFGRGGITLCLRGLSPQQECESVELSVRVLR